MGGQRLVQRMKSTFPVDFYPQIEALRAFDGCGYDIVRTLSFYMPGGWHRVTSVTSYLLASAES
jgi:hypothetical protein